MSDSFEIKVPGTDFIIRSESIYQVVNKLDPDAPDGYKEHKTTKVLDPNMTTVVYPKFNVGLDVWDLGFDKDSPCLRGMEKEQINKHLMLVQKHIVGPVERIKGKGYLNHKPKPLKEVIKEEGHSGLDSHSIILGIDRYFDTSKPLDLLNLYLAILNKDLAPKELEYHQDYDSADFAIVNEKEKVDEKQRSDYKKNKAIAKMIGLYETDKDFIIRMLKYCGIAVSKDSNEETVVTFFTRWLNSTQRSGDNADYFLNSLSRLSKKENEELYIYEILSELVKNQLIIRRNGEYLMEGETLGADLKVIAETANQKNSLKKAIFEKALIDDSTASL